MKLIKCILNLILSRNFNLINSPFQFLCFVEYIKNNKAHNPINNIIYVGYCSTLSRKQINNINKNIYKTNFEIYFLNEIFNVKIFYLLFFILKKIKRNFLFCICGTYKHFLFKEFVKKSNKTIFLDEGFDLIYHKNQEEIKKFEGKIFSCFEIQNKLLDVTKNNFNYLKNFRNQKSTIDLDLVFCLGTSFFESRIRLGGIHKYLNDVSDKFKNKKIYYFPHRAEKIDHNLYKNFNIKVIDMPIEIYVLQCDKLPSVICGFYSTALYTLKKTLEDKKIEIININFDLNSHRWDDSPDVDKHIDFKEILNKSGITNFY